MAEPDTPQDDGYVVVRFVYGPREWLPHCGPALGFWGLTTALGLMCVAACAGVSLWGLLLLVPVWLFAGRKLFAILAFLVRGSEAVELHLGTHAVSIGISADGGKTVIPCSPVRLEECQDVWLLVGNGGGVQLPIPKSSLGQSDRNRILAVIDRASSRGLPSN
jgi:hypothetical protein